MDYDTIDDDFVTIATTREREAASALADIVRRRLFPSEWVDHLDDIRYESGHVYQVQVSVRIWDTYLDANKKALEAYCEGFVDGYFEKASR